MIAKGTRFGMRFEDAFPRGLLQMGSVEPDYEYQTDRSRPSVQKRDEVTGRLQWKATVSDPDQTNAKRASFDLVFLADVQPVPESAELVANSGVRMVELEGLTVEPRVMGQGEFKYQGFVFRAESYRAATAQPAGRSATGKAA